MTLYSITSQDVTEVRNIFTAALIYVRKQVDTDMN